MAPGDKAEGSGGRGSPRGVSREESLGWDRVCGQHRHPRVRPSGDQKKKSMSEIDLIMCKNTQDILLNERKKLHNNIHAIISLFKQKKKKKSQITFLSINQ